MDQRTGQRHNEVRSNSAEAEVQRYLMTGAHDPWLLVDSITEAVGGTPGAIVVSGSHGGVSAARFAIEARVSVAVFNDAGVGRDQAGVAGLPLLEAQGIAACTVSHESARIGEAASTLRDGVISQVNAPCAALGAKVGQRLIHWLELVCGSESSSSSDETLPSAATGGER